MTEEQIREMQQQFMAARGQVPGNVVIQAAGASRNADACREAIPRLLEERAKLMEHLRCLLEVHCRERDKTRRGCHCFEAVEHSLARDAIAFAEEAAQ